MITSIVLIVPSYSLVVRCAHQPHTFRKQKKELSLRLLEIPSNAAMKLSDGKKEQKDIVPRE
jgi:hypothetical protein